MVGSVWSSSGWADVAAVATALAVIVALFVAFLPTLQRALHRPRLTLNFDSHMIVDELDPAGATVPYLRLAVTNEAGRDTAQDVEIQILDDIVESGTGNRIWLANPALGWTHFGARTQLPIPAGVTRYVDVGYWIRDGHQPDQLALVLNVIPQPLSGRHVLPRGEYRLRLAAILSNGPVKIRDAEFSF